MQNKPVPLQKITRDIVMKSQKSVKFHTAVLSTEVFPALLPQILSVWSPSTRTALDTEQQFILVLIRLRLGLLTDYLAHRFGISVSSVSRIFHSWLHAMAEYFRKFLISPPRQTVKCKCPKAFQDPLFENVRGIIDCTEIFIERLTSTTARSQTYFNYKHHNTAKLIVVISP
uniref:Tick transposon n=1 Tax=Rhipicephalus appendiculatus TaxID=34631 RepID=A0A131YKS9_RHIAP